MDLASKELVCKVLLRVTTNIETIKLPQIHIIKVTNRPRGV